MLREINHSSDAVGRSPRLAAAVAAASGAGAGLAKPSADRLSAAGFAVGPSAAAGAGATAPSNEDAVRPLVAIDCILPGEDVFAYIARTLREQRQQQAKGHVATDAASAVPAESIALASSFAQWTPAEHALYQRIVGAANAFKEGDATMQLAGALCLCLLCLSLLVDNPNPLLYPH
jgi:hypothetical protein